MGPATEGCGGVVCVSRRALKNQSGCLVPHWSGDGPQLCDPTVKYRI